MTIAEEATTELRALCHRLRDGTVLLRTLEERREFNLTGVDGRVSHRLDLSALDLTHPHENLRYESESLRTYREQIRERAISRLEELLAGVAANRWWINLWQNHQTRPLPLSRGVGTVLIYRIEVIEQAGLGTHQPEDDLGRDWPTPQSR